MEDQLRLGGSPSDSTTDSSARPLEDRLLALTALSDSDFELPQVQGIRLLTSGNDAGLYQITVTGYDGNIISLGRAERLEKASQIHDMIAIALYGNDYSLNFLPERYTVELYIDVLLTFQKLFPGDRFWEALRRGIDAGVVVNSQNIPNHPILSAFYKHHSTLASAQRHSNMNPFNQSTDEWPPFCPPWMLPRQPVVTQEFSSGPKRKRMKCARTSHSRAKNCGKDSEFMDFPTWCDGSVTVVGLESVDQEKTAFHKQESLSSYSKEETLSVMNEDDDIYDGEVCSRYTYPVRNFPANGVVQRRVTEAFTPPKPVIEYDFMKHTRDAVNQEAMEFDVYSRRTRRGRSVRQPARYREDSIQLSDSDNGADGHAQEQRKRKSFQFSIQSVSSVERKTESKTNASTNVVTLPHVRPIPKLDTVTIDERSEHLANLYRTSSQITHPFLKTIQPPQDQLL